MEAGLTQRSATVAFTRAPADLLFVAVRTGWLHTTEVLPVATTCRELAVRVDAYLRHDALELRVRNARPREDVLVRLLERCRALQAVELCNCGPDLSDLALFAMHGLRLRELRLADCPGLSAGGVREAVLRQASFAEAIRILDVDIAPLYVADEPDLPHIVEFGAQSHGSNDEAAAVAAKVVRASAGSLRVLRLRGFELQQIPVILAAVPSDSDLPGRLDALHVIGEPSYTEDDPVMGVGAIGIRLGEFTCDGRFCTNSILSQVARGSTSSLRILKLSGKGLWTSLESVAENCPGLRELDIRDRALLGDTVISPVLAHCHALERLCVLGARGLTSISVRSAAVSCPNLSRLDLAGCELVDDGALHALAEYARCIEELSLSGCKLITNNGLKALAKSPLGPRVRRLEVANCSKLSDEGFLAVARWMRAMRRVDCSWCTLVTPFSLEEVILECPMLASLSMHGISIPSTDAIVLAKRSQGPFCLDLGAGATFHSSGRPRGSGEPSKPAIDPATVRARRHAAARAKSKRRAKSDLRKLEQTLLENGLA
ncbi:F-box/LRR-repeat protein 20 [Hondaea fermentalgiana]|uniref:F-box/LRR-repeat protein 20 n=1 Tax=Hondaea fermentalgiana TaxID=2315210 RepID=A0A2R5GHU2_9STRA|nr:F-box/LRR-repeat protein 20 [Hondaea fermentalgiana]|eukprot:GBG28223.1 F-box/LRR-repeat protein 20 [Hondaea fermentalgiana]